MPVKVVYLAIHGILICMQIEQNSPKFGSLDIITSTSDSKETNIRESAHYTLKNDRTGDKRCSVFNNVSQVNFIRNHNKNVMIYKEGRTCIHVHSVYATECTKLRLNSIDHTTERLSKMFSGYRYDIAQNYSRLPNYCIRTCRTICIQQLQFWKENNLKAHILKILCIYYTFTPQNVGGEICLQVRGLVT